MNGPDTTAMDIPVCDYCPAPAVTTVENGMHTGWKRACANAVHIAWQQSIGSEAPVSWITPERFPFVDPATVVRSSCPAVLLPGVRCDVFAKTDGTFVLEHDQRCPVMPGGKEEVDPS